MGVGVEIKQGMQSNETDQEHMAREEARTQKASRRIGAAGIPLLVPLISPSLNRVVESSGRNMDKNQSARHSILGAILRKSLDGEGAEL